MAQCLTHQTPVVEPPRPLFMATGGLDRAEPFYFSRVNNSWPLARPPAGKQKQRRGQAGVQVASRTLHKKTRLFFSSLFFIFFFGIQESAGVTPGPPTPNLQRERKRGRGAARDSLCMEALTLEPSGRLTSFVMIKRGARLWIELVTLFLFH